MGLFTNQARGHLCLVGNGPPLKLRRIEKDMCAQTWQEMQMGMCLRCGALQVSSLFCPSLPLSTCPGDRMADVA